MMTVVVTDSGIGGYAVAAELYARLKAQSLSARIIFFNALFDENSGYNRLKTLTEKAEKFDTALCGMMALTPGVLCIACNTLSVIYPHTAFVKAAPIPVIGIIEIGVDALLARMAGTAQPRAVLFATPTTIQQGEHVRRLRELRPDAQFVEQPCPELMRAIECGAPKEIEARIHEYVMEAARHIPAETAALFAGLFCTHFGYFPAKFQREFRKLGMSAEIINPNTALVEAMLETLWKKFQDNESPVRIECVSKTRISPEAIATLAPLLSVYGEETVAALQAYRQDSKLF